MGKDISRESHQIEDREDKQEAKCDEKPPLDRARNMLGYCTVGNGSDQQCDEDAD